MGRRTIPEQLPPLIEPVYHEPIFGAELAKVERVGSNLLLWFCYRSSDADGTPVRIVSGKLLRPAGDIMPADCVLAMADGRDVLPN